MTKNISIPLHHTVHCNWHLDNVFLAEGQHVVEGNVSAPWWERAEGRNWPGGARKGKEKGSAEEGKDERHKGR